MTKVIEMPEVMKCEAKGCAYNLDSTCHARGITVGDPQHRHLCDTIWTEQGHTRRMECAGVGACREKTCKHNEDLECQADGISVSLSNGQAQCTTFSAR